jgi:hypothetical protein
MNDPDRPACRTYRALAAENRRLGFVDLATYCEMQLAVLEHENRIDWEGTCGEP